MKRAEDQALDLGRLSRLAAVVRDARDAIIVQSPQGKLLAWNFAAEQLYGWPRADTLGRFAYEIIPAVRFLNGETIEGILQLLANHGEWRGPVVQHTRDGRELLRLGLRERHGARGECGHTLEANTAIPLQLEDAARLHVKQARAPGVVVRERQGRQLLPPAPERRRRPGHHPQVGVGDIPGRLRVGRQLALPLEHRPVTGRREQVDLAVVVDEERPGAGRVEAREGRASALSSTVSSNSGATAPWVPSMLVSS